MKKKFSCLLLSAGMGLVMAHNAMAQNIQSVSQLSTIRKLTVARGTNVFSTAFNKTATGRNDMNAYLMAYITTLVYPQYLAITAGDASESFINRMHSGGVFFQNEYKKNTAFLFNSPEYTFVTESHPLGYDPEAMVISTPDVVYVIFRGTDRVAGNKVSSFMYDWGEWLLSDFDAAHVSPPELTGKVHRGFWNSISYNNFKDKLLQVIREKAGTTRKIWIGAHSLGSAQAQVFAMYMAKKGIPAHALYLLAAPHAGTQEFVTELNRLYPGGRLQRFDFSSDPVTTLAPYTLGYRRAGTRVFYKDIKSIDFGAEERSPVEAGAIVSAILGVAGINLAGSQFCYHHPTWYLRAAYSQLSASEREKVPVPLPIPEIETVNGFSEACDALTINKGKNASVPGSLIEEGVAAVAEGLEKLKFVASTILDNVTGTSITEGDYYIRPYTSTTGLGLNEAGGLDNGSSLRLTPARSKVKVQRYGTIGYTIRFGVKNGKEYVLDSKAEDLFDDGSTTIQLWEKNAFPALSANQRWLFIRLKNDKYLVKNLANGKLLDANNSCLNTGDCGVKTWNPVTDDQTQVWILEKAN